MKRLLKWFVAGLVLLVAIGCIQRRAEPSKVASATEALVTVEIPDSVEEEPELRRLSATYTKKIFSRYPKAMVPLDCFAKYKAGFMDAAGRLVIPRCFDQVNSFSDGVARVALKGKSENLKDIRYGYIDRSGVFVIPPILKNDQFLDAASEFSYDASPREFSEGLLPLRHEPKGKIGYIDKTGKFVIPPQFRRAESFSNGLALVRACLEKSCSANAGGDYGYINRQGKFVVPPQYSGGSSFNNGVAIVFPKTSKLGNGEYPEKGLIDTKGNALVEPLLTVIGFEVSGYPIKKQLSFDSGLLRVQAKIPPAKTNFPLPVDNYKVLWGYVGKVGGYKIKPKFEFVGRFSQGIAGVLIPHDSEDYAPEWRGRMVLIDTNGRIIDTTKQNPELELGSLPTFSEGLAAVKTTKSDLYGFIGRDGQWKIPQLYPTVRDFSNGLAAVIPSDSDRKWAYINLEGKVVIPAKFSWAEPFVIPELARVEAENGKKGVINRKGDYVLPPNYDYTFINKTGVIGFSWIKRIINDKGWQETSPTFFMTPTGKLLPYVGYVTNADIKEGLIPVSGKLPEGFKP